MAFFVLYNLTESSVLRHNTIFHVMYVVGTALAFGAVPRKARAAPVYQPQADPADPPGPPPRAVYRWYRP
jgi:hypothetical protein